MANDFLGLKKIDQSFRDFDKQFTKSFSTLKDKPQYKAKGHKRRQQTPRKHNDMENIKTLAKEGRKTLAILYKVATKNIIPKKYEEVMAMRDQLELEKKQRYEIAIATQQIKKLQKEKKIEDRQRRAEKINKIKSVFSREKKPVTFGDELK